MRTYCKRALCAILLLALLFSACVAEAEEQDISLLVMNVGKADCLLLSVYGEYYLIDTGYEHTYGTLKSVLSEYGITRLAGVFLTHAHEDHQGGLAHLAASDIAVDAWYASAIWYDVKEGKHPLINAAASRGQEALLLRAQQTLALRGGAKLTVLGPVKADTTNENNNSLVLRLDSKDGSMLLCGDMKQEEEAQLCVAGVVTHADVLKVGHHGDDKATSATFANLVAPRVAVISTSTKEEPDTPAPVVLRRLQSVGCETYVTQDTELGILITLRQGDISVEALAWKQPATTALTLHIDNARDLLTINNAGEALDLSGYAVYSSRGSDCFFLPEGTTIASGATLTLGSGITEDTMDIKLSEKRVWHKSKRDECVLYDAYSRDVARTDNGMPE